MEIEGDNFYAMVLYLLLELWLSPSIISDIEGKWFICDHLRGRYDLNGLNLFCKIKGNTPFQSNFSTH